MKEMDKHEQFRKERAASAEAMASDEELKKKSVEWMVHADRYKYSYNYSWLGRPIIKYPSDIVALQEVVWRTKPDLIIETGIAHGGSAILSASILELIGKGEVLAIDIDIREHNKEAIEAHSMSKRISMLEGSSLDSEIIEKVRERAAGKEVVMVVLDSHHTHEHVLKELELYSPFVSEGSYLILPDTFIEEFPEGYFADRPWDVGNNPMTALREFMKSNEEFEIDREVCNKLMIAEGFDAYLKRKNS